MRSEQGVEYLMLPDEFRFYLERNERPLSSGERDQIRVSGSPPWLHGLEGPWELLQLSRCKVMMTWRGW